MFNESVRQAEEIISIAGCFNWTSYSEVNQKKLVKALLRFHILDRLRAPLDQYVYNNPTTGIIYAYIYSAKLAKQCV